MKRFLLSLVMVLPFSYLVAQTCSPDPAYQDSTGVFPMPYDSIASPDGGITECAIINEFYDFVFTVAVGDSITVVVSGIPFSLPLDSVKVNDVDGLPVGLNYACDPADCTFPKNTLGCAVIYGTPTNANAAGDYPLTIHGTAYFPVFPGQFDITFPDPSFAPGEYTLQLLPDNATPCTVVGTKESLADKVSLAILPNPSAGPVQVKVVSKISGKFDLTVRDLLGREAHRSTVDLMQGENSLSFDGSLLSNGLYLLTLENSQGRVAVKMAIHR